MANSLGDYGIFNMPHQFLSTSDPRLPDEIEGTSGWKGRVYNEYFLTKAPIVTFKVGRPAYMGDVAAVSDDELEAIYDDTENMADWLDSLFGDSGNEMYYYTFEDDFETYCNYVNGMVRYAAVKMDIDEYKRFNLNDTKFRNGNWLTDFFAGGLGLTTYFSYYCDVSSTSFSESGSNSTTESQMASGIKNLGQTQRELSFLFGVDTIAGSDATTSFSQYSSNLKSTYKTVMGSIDSVLNKVSGMFTSVTSGANVLFPEIWSDSSFRNNISVGIKLFSPYGDKKSVFENVYIPFFCLLAMALPRQSGKQGFTGPFLVQCFSKGWFSCSCGMIESIDIKKSPNSEWTVDDLPSEIDVTLNIKDLYPTVLETSMDSIKAFGNNVGLTTYLKTMCGVTLIDFNPTSNIEEAFNTIINSFTDIPMKIYNKAQKAIGNPVKKAITRIFGGMN